FSTVASEADADPPLGTSCDWKRAKPEFTSGIEHYSRKEWELAIPGLSKAAKLCPVHGKVMEEFSYYYYVPFFYLGECHYYLSTTENSFNALRHFYLSRCLEEPTRSDITKDLNKLTADCRRGLASKRPQQNPPEFNEGLKSFDHDWDRTAENMWDALQIEPDDGQMKPSGRWPDPYLPGLRLAKALVELGCVQEACTQYDRFQFKGLLAREDTRTKFQTERQIMAQLDAECAGKNRERTAYNATCQRWRCWVREGRP